MSASVNILGSTIQQDDLFKGIDGACAACAAFEGLRALTKIATGEFQPSDIARGMLAGAMASKYSTDLKEGLWNALEAVDKIL